MVNIVTIVSNVAGGAAKAAPLGLAELHKESGVQAEDLQNALSTETFSEGLSSVTENLAAETVTEFSAIGNPTDILNAATPALVSLSSRDLSAVGIQNTVSAANGTVREIDSLLNTASAKIPDFSEKLGSIPNVGAISDLLPDIQGLGGISLSRLPSMPGLSAVPNPSTLLSGNVSGGSLISALQDTAGSVTGVTTEISSVTNKVTDKLAPIATSAVTTDPDTLKAAITDVIGDIG